MAKQAILLSLALLLVGVAHTQDKHQKPTKYQKDSLRNEVDAMLAEDQKYRWVLMFGELDEQKLAAMRKLPVAEHAGRMRDVRNNKAGLTQVQKDSIGALQDAIDSVNFAKLTGIIRSFGFPNGYVEAWKASTILLHATPRQLTPEYLKMLKDEVAAGNLPAIDYAQVYDRNLNNQNLPPLYGEYGEDKPPSIGETNKARIEIGLKKYKG